MSAYLGSFDATSGAYAEGDSIFRRGSVTLFSREPSALLFRVGSTPPQEVRIYPQGQADCSCGCEGEPCVHMAAAFLLAQQDGSFRQLTQEHSLSIGRQMLAALSRAMPGCENVRLNAVLRLNAF